MTKEERAVARPKIIALTNAHADFAELARVISRWNILSLLDAADERDELLKLEHDLRERLADCRSKEFIEMQEEVSMLRAKVARYEGALKGDA